MSAEQRDSVELDLRDGVESCPKMLIYEFAMARKKI